MITNSKIDLFEPQSLSLSSIFQNEDPIYQIPDYQRPYSGLDEQLEQLWDDLIEAYENNKEDDSTDSNYFFGSLIVAQKSTAEDIVGGQRGLTTLMTLLCVLRQLYSKTNKNVDARENPSVIKADKVKNCIADTNELNRLRQ